MTDRLIRGLTLYAGGDLVGAARLWLSAQRDEPENRQLEAYLQHLRSHAPRVVEQVEAELGRSSSAAAASGPGDFDVDVEVDAGIPLPASEPGLDLTPSDDPWGGDAALGSAVTVAPAAQGLALVAARRPPMASGRVGAPEEGRADLHTLEARMRELNELDDFSGALAVAERIIRLEPEHVVALVVRARCREILVAMHTSKIGDLRDVPRVLVPADQVIWLDLDHRAGFVLSQVDGMSSFHDIVEVTGMDQLESLGILAKLVTQRIIGVAGAATS